jgi:pSer/pThr/pTyr-binding forkhead associated (FHA) protein
MTLGLVCDSCDALSPLNATTCQSCGSSLGIVPAAQAARPRPVESSGSSRRCPNCGTEVAAGFRFCGACGKALPDAGAPVAEPKAAPPEPSGPQLRKSGQPGKTMFFGAMQQARAKLILIKGDGLDGVSYVLSSTEHVAGRAEGALLFPEDALLSPRHANFIYREGKLYVRDEGSCNGVFVRIIRPQSLSSGSLFLVGEQLLRVEDIPREDGPIPDEEGTYFYASPKRPARMALVQMLAGGWPGVVFRAREDSITIGREGNDVNFPNDPFISGRHASLQAVDTPQGSRFQLADLGSKNGTFLRIQDETQLFHGDYVFLGQQLLRVEIT